MASGTLPVFYDFRKLGGLQFCDGGLLSNTPFRELLQAHRDYWLQVMGTNKDKILDLEVYIINDHPSKGTYINDDDLDGQVSTTTCLSDWRIVIKLSRHRNCPTSHRRKDAHSSHVSTETICYKHL